MTAAKVITPAKMINQQLITVRPTFLLPAKKSGKGEGGSKFASDCTMLKYGVGGEHVRGMGDITSNLVRQ